MRVLFVRRISALPARLTTSAGGVRSNTVRSPKRAAGSHGWSPGLRVWPSRTTMRTRLTEIDGEPGDRAAASVHGRQGRVKRSGASRGSGFTPQPAVTTFEGQGGDRVRREL